MAKLSLQQQAVVNLEGDVFVTACPGSGKTRVLTEKIVATLEEGIPVATRIAALTFTNRAADEIALRLQDAGLSQRQLWTGTIHSFALEWILRPYSSYDPLLRYGFAVADEFVTRKTIDSLRSKHGVKYVDDLRLGYGRDGELLHDDPDGCALITECREQLRARKLIDFDCVLYLAYDLLRRKPQIAKTLGTIFRLFCIDEYQDTQDLQFGILSTIAKASNSNTTLFIVGDKNQAIYASLGGMAKTIQEIKHEFGRVHLKHRELSGNWRSTQRIVDFCSNVCEAGDEQITSMAEYADEGGLITYANRDIHKSDLAEAIGRVVQHHLDQGVKPEEICILGPSWWLLTELGRRLVIHLPDIDLDAPGLSPLKYQPDSLWFKLARLFLTDPTPTRYRARHRWASDFVTHLEANLGRELDEGIRTPRSILRLVNALTSVEDSGLAFLDDVFDQFFAALELDLSQHSDMVEARQSFFDAAEARLIDKESELETVENLKKMFRHPSGVVVNSCHGSKGEEYEVVICFGLLRGYIPHWKRIFADEEDARLEARRILYVIASRAKKCVHLFSEDGHTTKSGNQYEPTRELLEFEWEYDELPEG